VSSQHASRGDEVTPMARISCAADRLTLLMSSSFGASISDIFGALLNGAGLFPFNLKEEELLHLGDWLNNEEITVYHSVPTVFRHLVATLKGTEQFSKLRLVKLGGESVHRKDFEKFKRYFPPSCLFQVGFGATEINTICQYFCDHQSTFEGYHRACRLRDGRYGDIAA